MKIILLGASRGLGASTQEILRRQNPDCEIFSFSRSSAEKMDFSKIDRAPELVTRLSSLNATRLIYFAGGGPFGNFGEKQFKDHEWAMHVNYTFPALLLHSVLQKPLEWRALRQISFIGSAIAEASPDPRAASYAAAKHALVGLITSIQKENHGSLDLRLFSPGYMNTGLLPKNAWPRQGEGVSQSRVRSPVEVAEFLVSWLENTESANQHQVFE